MKKLLTLIILSFPFLASAQFGLGDSLFTMEYQVDHQMVDIDNDGDLDVLSISNSNILWYENTGDFEFGDEHIIMAASGLLYTSRITLADVNEDGWMDFATAYNDGGSKIGWFENNGDGTFTEHNILSGTSFNAYQYYDDDADGDYDLIFTQTLDNVFRMNGNADDTFDAAVELDLSLDFYYYNYQNIYHTDFNGDGNEDLLFSCTYEGGGAIELALMYAENLGGGTYGSAVILYANDDISDPKMGVFEDIDGDGDEDAILGHGYESYQLRYYENTGTAYVRHDPVIGYSHAHIALADLDLDGDLDISGGYGKSKHQYFLGNGDGSFSDETVLYPELWGDTGWLDAFGTMHVLDSDGDGDMEVFGSVVQDYFYFIRYENLIYDIFNAEGFFFADLNENGVADPGEPGVDFPDISSDPAEVAYFIYDDGNYIVNYETTGTYTLTPALPEGWGITTPDTEYTFTVDGVTTVTGLDFGIYPTVDIDSIDTDLTGAFPRCNDTIPYWISIGNLGTTHPGGVVALTLHDSISFVASELPVDSIVDQTIYWSYDSIAWYSDYMIDLSVAMPDFLSEGEFVTSYLTVSIMEDDMEIFLVEDSLTQMIACAYDPNDKTGLPIGEGEYGFIGMDETFIEYTIRFQNTGTDTAFTVRIEDQLDENYDWESLEVISKSHDMTWSIDETGLVEFLFADIELPDSNVNVLASQGYVKYKVWMNEGLPSGTSLENTAGIFFDLNPAIITNTTVHTLFECTAILDSVILTDVVCPEEPILGTAGIDMIPPSLAYSWTVEGEVIEGLDLEYMPEEPGLYEVVVNANTEFCEASTSFMVNVLEPIAITELPLLTICYGDSLDIFGTYQSTGGIYSDTLSSLEFGCDSIITQEVMIDSTSLDITGLESDEICLEAAATELAGSPSGGTFSGTGIDGESFNPATAGEGAHAIYYTYISDAGCENIDSVAVTVISCLGISGPNSAELTVYPNPFKDQVTVSFASPLASGTSAVLTDLSGKQVAVYTNLGGTQTLLIERRNLSKGEYILHIIGESDKILATVKLVAQ